jgi:hypothetical protein
VRHLTGNRWAIAIVTKGLKENLSAISGKHLIDSPQKTHQEHHTLYGKYGSVEREAGTKQIASGSTEVPGRTGLLLKT